MIPCIIDVVKNNFPIITVDDQNSILYTKQSWCSTWWAHVLEDSMVPFKTELQDGAVFMVTHLLIWRLITMLQFFSRSDSEAVESNLSFESRCLLRHTLILSSNLHHVLLSGLVSWHFLVNILYALLISFHFCASFLSVAVPC